MKKLKLRVWDTQLNNMHYPENIFCRSLISDCLSVNLFKVDPENDVTEIKQAKGFKNRFNFLLYTGQKDKEGNEIYDGDIIEFDRIEWGGDDNIHVVSWNNDDAEWCWGGGSTHDMEWRKVIGNIYETPELLEEPA